MANVEVPPAFRPSRTNDLSDRRRRAGFGGSRLGRLILGLNLLGLAILVIGALVLNEFSRGLVQARIDSLSTQAQLISYVIVKAATAGDPEPSMDADAAREILELLAIPRTERARLYDARGKLIADTDVIADKVSEQPLAPARPEHPLLDWRPPAYFSPAAREARAHAAEQREVAAAVAGRPVAQVRASETGGRLVSVSVPIQHVQAVLGVLTLESGDVGQIVAKQRAALLPFILIAVAAVLSSSILLNGAVAEPIRRLARAADSVRLARARAISLPDIGARQDEVGDLARSLDAMTTALTTRMDAIERFAADVSHEIKNPLTSMRSALETMDMLPPGPGRERLAALLAADVKRLDRLITDISNASRLDAELSRDKPRTFDLARFLADVVGLYDLQADAARVELILADPSASYHVAGREGPLGQVFRNLLDNARSFSPADGAVRVHLQPAARREGPGWVVVDIDDDGPGVPAENLESIFNRFYTNRPKGRQPGGSAFGGHSGLGLSIARQIVEAHGGRLAAENRPAADGEVAGARFRVELPAARS